MKYYGARRNTKGQIEEVEVTVVNTKIMNIIPTGETFTTEHEASAALARKNLCSAQGHELPTPGEEDAAADFASVARDEREREA